MRRRLLPALLLITLLGALSAAPALAAGKQRPIVYVVVIDGLDGDNVDAGGAPFISSLLAGQGARATYFPQSRSVIPAETNPNHTAMMSGAFPGSSGVPSNGFALYAPLMSDTTCVTTGPFDFSAAPSTTDGESSSCPQAEFTFESIRRQGNPDGLRTAAIFGKPKLGRIFSGAKFDPARRDVDHLWAPCDSDPDDDDYCGEVPVNPISGYAVDDRTVMDEVIRTINQGIGPGEPRRPDFTFVNLHQVDSAGHATGTGALYQSSIALADMEIQRLVNTLRSRGEWDRTALILVSDHSMELTPQKVSLKSALTDAGISEDDFRVVQAGSADLIYLANRRSTGRFALLKQMREAALASPGVAEALYREPNPMDGGEANTIDRAHPGSAGERMGDLLVFSSRGAAFSDPSSSSNPLPGNHGGPQTADNFLAVTSGGTFVRQGTVTGEGRAANPFNTEIASTVMGLLGLGRTEDNQGRFLSPAFDRGALAAIARPYKPRFRVLRGRRGKPSGGAGRPASARPLPGAKNQRSRRLRLLLRPKGGNYDLQVRTGKRWVALLKNSPRAAIRLRGRAGRFYKLRGRVGSAAGIESRWRVRRVRF